MARCSGGALAGNAIDAARRGTRPEDEARAVAVEPCRATGEPCRAARPRGPRRCL